MPGKVYVGGREVANMFLKERTLATVSTMETTLRRDPSSAFMFFADDSRQAKPTRPGMGHLVAVGGFRIASTNVARTQLQIDQMCTDAGFPGNDPFKWSPGHELWMRTNLVGDKRLEFYSGVVHTLQAAGAVATIVISDTTCASATKAPTAEGDVVTMLLERINHQCGRLGSVGIVVADRPGGGQHQEEEFLLECYQVLKTGTGFTRFESIAHVDTSPLRTSRLLQAADLITSCTLAFVSGEASYSPTVFDWIRPLLDRVGGRAGGSGLKLHPDGRYANLYHWIAGDADLRKGSEIVPLPSRRWAFAAGPSTCW